MGRGGPVSFHHNTSSHGSLSDSVLRGAAGSSFGPNWISCQGFSYRLGSVSSAVGSSVRSDSLRCVRCALLFDLSASQLFCLIRLIAMSVPGTVRRTCRAVDRERLLLDFGSRFSLFAGLCESVTRHRNVRNHCQRAAPCQAELDRSRGLTIVVPALPHARPARLRAERPRHCQGPRRFAVPS